MAPSTHSKSACILHLQHKCVGVDNPPPCPALSFSKAGTTQNSGVHHALGKMLLPLSSGWDREAESVHMRLAR